MSEYERSVNRQREPGVSDLDPSPEPPKPTSGPTSGSRLWRVILGRLAGVIAGAARGAAIGAAVGAGACFLALMVYGLYVATTPPDPGATVGDILGLLVIAAIWFGIAALTFGGIAG